MKTTRKFIFISLILALLCPIFMIGISAEGADAAVSEGNIRDIEHSADGAGAENTDGTENTDGNTENTGGTENTDGSTENTGGAQSLAGDSKDESAGFFAVLYQAVAEHSAEIGSITAAVASILLAFSMKRGLAPMLKDALGKMLGALGKLGEDVEKNESALSSRLEAAERTVEKLSEAVGSLEKRSESDEEEQAMREDVLTVMSAQIELLYDIFMSSALPQYKKDAVGERVSEMRKQLGYRGVEGDEA